MKTLAWMFVVATCWAALAWSQTTVPPEIILDEIDKKCLAAMKVSKEYFVDFLSGRVKPGNVPPNFKCFTRCNLETRNLTMDGVVLEENVVKAADNITTVVQLRKILADCGFKKGKDVCETSFNVFVCLSDEL